MSQRCDRHPRRDAGNLQDGAITLTLSSANPCMGISLASSLAGITRACLVTQCVFGRPACACMHMWGSGMCAWDRDLVRVCVHLDLAGMGSGVWGQPHMKLWGGGRHGHVGIQHVGSQLVGKGAGTACGILCIRTHRSPPTIQNVVSTDGPWALKQSVKGVLGKCCEAGCQS